MGIVYGKGCAGVMRDFDYAELSRRSWRGDSLQTVAQIHEHKGQQLLHLRQKPKALSKLVEMAKTQSVDASNRLEGIVTTASRLRDLALEKTTPRNRSEQEIAGYRQVLNLIHERHDAIPLSPNVLLQLHRDLFAQVPGAAGGRFRSTPNRRATSR